MMQVLSTLNCQQQAEYFEQHRIRTWVRAQAVASLQATFPCFNTTAVKDALTSVAWYYLTALASMADDTMRRTLATASEADCLRMLNTVLVPLQNNDTLQNGKLGFGVSWSRQGATSTQHRKAKSLQTLFGNSTAVPALYHCICLGSNPWCTDAY